MVCSYAIGSEGERLARQFLKKHFPDLEVSPRGFDRSLGPADFLIKNPNNNRIRALIQVKTGEKEARITRGECKRLINQAKFLGGTPYVLLRIGPLRGGSDICWSLETAQHAIKYMGSSSVLIQES